MRIFLKDISLFVLSVFMAIAVNGESFTDSELKKIRDTYETRRAEAFELLRDKPLVREKIIPPIFSDGSDFSRHYSYSLMDYAFKCLWLGEDIEGANAALLENADYYIGYPRAYTDKDSFYWATDEMCKMLEFYGSKGTLKSGLIGHDVEERIFLMMWQYSKTQSKVAKAEYKKSRTWYVDESENHHVQRFYAAWHFAKFLKDHPDYRDKKYDDGFTATQHFDAWNNYIKEWTVERARKGLFVEMANDSYGLETLKGVYNFYEFGDAQLRDISQKLLDLYWAAWAQEQIDNVRAGAKSRVYPYEASKGRTPFRKMAWYYMGAGEINAPYNNLFTLITSEYRMPEVVMDIALDREGRGTYEITQRRQGRAEQGFFTPPDYHLSESGGLIRYTYCTPEFMAGSLFCEALPYENWALISSQNRWAGVVFAGDPDSRIFVHCRTGGDNRAYNQFWGVQNRGAMIFHKLRDSLHSRGANEIRLWISDAGLSGRVESHGWIFLKSRGAYVAVKSMGKYSLEKVERGTWLIPKDQYSPIIVEVALQSDFSGYDDFQRKILATKSDLKANRVNYVSIYGDRLSLPTDYKGLPSVNEIPIELEPSMAMASPFVETEFNSAIVRISKGNRKLELDFNKVGY